MADTDTTTEQQQDGAEPFEDHAADAASVEVPGHSLKVGEGAGWIGTQRVELVVVKCECGHKAHAPNDEILTVLIRLHLTEARLEALEAKVADLLSPDVLVGDGTGAALPEFGACECYRAWPLDTHDTCDCDCHYSLK